MKTTKIIYWAATAIVSIMMAYSTYAYLSSPAIAQAFHHLGFPDYLRVELALAKLIGAIILIAPVSARVKEWAYAGFAIIFISAFVAHTASGDPVAMRAMPIMFLLLLVVSYVMYHKLPGKSLQMATA
jgi:DoxX-like family